MSERTLAKAKSYLSEGKVLVVRAGRSEAFFAVQGSDITPYSVRAYALVWECNCKAQVECAHIQACKLIYKLPETLDDKKLFRSNEEMDKLFQKMSPYEPGTYPEEYEF